MDGYTLTLAANPWNIARTYNLTPGQDFSSPAATGLARSHRSPTRQPAEVSNLQNVFGAKSAENGELWRRLTLPRTATWYTLPCPARPRGRTLLSYPSTGQWRWSAWHIPDLATCGLQVPRTFHFLLLGTGRRWAPKGHMFSNCLCGSLHTELLDADVRIAAMGQKKFGGRGLDSALARGADHFSGERFWEFFFPQPETHHLQDGSFHPQPSEPLLRIRILSRSETDLERLS